MNGGLEPSHNGDDSAFRDDESDLQINKVSDRGPLDVELC